MMKAGGAATGVTGGVGVASTGAEGGGDVSLRGLPRPRFTMAGSVIFVWSLEKEFDARENITFY